MNDEEIELNGIKYVLKRELEKQQVQRFPFATEMKLLKAFNQLFSLSSNPISEEYATAIDVIIVDPANVCLCRAKSKEAKILLSRFRDFEVGGKPNPNGDLITNLDYKLETGISSASVRLSKDYFNKILMILSIGPEQGFRITTKSDYPAKIENNHFEFILAPMINSEEEK